MPLAGFKPAIPASKRRQTYALDCVATGIVKVPNTKSKCFLYVVVFGMCMIICLRKRVNESVSVCMHSYMDTYFIILIICGLFNDATRRSDSTSFK
jgi:hypothetical protein